MVSVAVWKMQGKQPAGMQGSFCIRTGEQMYFEYFEYFELEN